LSATDASVVWTKNIAVDLTSVVLQK
jgi:hypothetical protein